MVNDEIISITELYKKVLPALRIKKREFNREKIYFAKEKDIWSCLEKTIWQSQHNLTLFDIVNDILNLKLDYFLDFLKQENE